MNNDANDFLLCFGDLNLMKNLLESAAFNYKIKSLKKLNINVLTLCDSSIYLAQSIWTDNRRKYVSSLSLN